LPEQCHPNEAEEPDRPSLVEQLLPANNQPHTLFFLHHVRCCQ